MTTAPFASSVRSGVKSAGGRAPAATMRPAARAIVPGSSRPVAGSTSRALEISKRSFMF